MTLAYGGSRFGPIMVRSGKGTVTPKGTFTDVFDQIKRVVRQHDGWQSVHYYGRRYQLHGGIRTDWFIVVK